MKKKFVGAVLVLVTVNCVGDPTGTGGAVTLQRIAAPGDTLIVGAPGRLLAQPVAFRLLDGYGKPLPAARVHWSITSGNGQLVRTDTISGPDGTLKAQWMLGTKASDVQRLHVGVRLGGGHAPTAEVTASAVPVEVTALAIQAETTDVRLAVHAQLQVQATDPFGNHFVPKDLRFVSLDTTVTADSAGVVVPHHRGFARVIATAGGVTDTAVVHGIQVVASIQIDHDTLRFHSLGQDEKLGVTLVDDQGLQVADSLPVIVPSDTSVVALQVTNPLIVKSKANGVTTVNLSTSTASRSAVAVVRQRTASLAFTAASFALDALNDTVRTRLIALDSLGVPVQAPRITFASSDTGVVAIDTSGLLRARGNGSAMIQAQSLSGIVATVPAVVAQRVARIAVARDTVLFDALHAQLPINAVALDRLGSSVVGVLLTYESESGSVVAIDGTGRIEALANGATRVIAAYGADSGAVVVRVKQRPVRVVVATDTVRLNALGQTRTISAVAEDSLGSPLVDGVVGVAVADTAVVGAADSSTVQARANGVSTATFSVAGLPGQVVVRVAQVPASVRLDAAAFAFDALNDTLRAVPQVSDSLGTVIALAPVTYYSSDTTVATVDTAGLVRARSNGSARLFAQAGAGVAATVTVNVAQQVARIAVARDTIVFDALRAVLPVAATGLDRLGSPVVGAALTYASTGTAVATVDANGQIQALTNGTTGVVAVHGTDSGFVLVRVQQRPVRVQVASDTLTFDALGEDHQISAVALDSLGSPVVGGIVGLRVGDTTLAQLVDSTTARARQNGVTAATFTVAGLPAAVTLNVSQVATSLSAAVTFGKPIVTLPVGAPLPVACQAADRNGYPVTQDPALVGSVNGTVTGAGCGDVRVQRSGYDTLLFVLGAAQARVPVVVAAAPIAQSPLGDFVVADTLPGDAGNTWAPSARRNSRGDLEVYYTAWAGTLDSTGYNRGNLQRLVWLSGNQFRYDGLAVAHDDSICSRQGQGIENMVIVRRADGAGWRMLYAAGSNDCYGWQVFSAVSSDERTWTKEPGIRLSNGGTAQRGSPPWPVGEGMVVDQLPTGEWRMIVSTYEHIDPPENKWQITEWRSPDQINWTYIGPVLTTRDMPEGWQGSVYSPTIRQIAPGLWRMLFTADGRPSSGSRSATWSAVSTDRGHWQVEGELFGSPSSNLYYAAMVDDHVIFARLDNGGSMHLSIANVIMP